MSKVDLINEVTERFLKYNRPDEKGCRLAKVYLEVVKEHGSASLIHHSKRWKQNRAKKIKESCETCGSKESLHISHVWHPRKGWEMRKLVEDKYSAEIQEWNRSHSPLFSDGLRDGCPFCDGKVLNFRKTTNDYRCGSKKHGEYCHQEFEKPVKVRDEKLIRQSKYEHELKIYRYYYALEHISQGQRYVEMRDEDILTECKACGWERDRPRTHAELIIKYQKSSEDK